MAKPVEIVIRGEQAGDQPQIRAVLKTSPEAATWADTYPILIAEVEGGLVGFALYRVIAGEGELLNLVVHPDIRRCGVGRRLLLGIAPLADIWHLEVRESNHAAIALYASLGLAQSGRRERYYVDGEAALLFSGHLHRIFYP